MSTTTRLSRNTDIDVRGEKRSNATHASVPYPVARLSRKSSGTGAMLCFMGHPLMENRTGLIVRADLTQADGYGDRKALLHMINRHSPGSTRQLALSADK